MKYLFVGDVHNHKYIFEDVHQLDEKYKFDKIVFVGDYVDDWKTDNHNSLETLNIVINLKNTNPDKYFFTLGNHELSYLGYPCSGHKYELEDVVKNKLEENIDCFDCYKSIICGQNEFICTHAGLTYGYATTILGEDWKTVLDEFNANILKNLKLLTLCSNFRGGNSKYSSFLWSDIREHKYLRMLEEKYIPNQIIGHTPVKSVYYDNEANHYFIDTHSTYSDGTPIGDKSYLMWNDTEFLVVNNV